MPRLLCHYVSWQVSANTWYREAIYGMSHACLVTAGEVSVEQAWFCACILKLELCMFRSFYLSIIC
jgi:hypothetical protein